MSKMKEYLAARKETQINVRLPEELKLKLQRQFKGKSLSDVLRERFQVISNKNNYCCCVCKTEDYLLNDLKIFLVPSFADSKDDDYVFACLYCPDCFDKLIKMNLETLKAQSKDLSTMFVIPCAAINLCSDTREMIHLIIEMNESSHDLKDLFVELVKYFPRDFAYCQGRFAFLKYNMPLFEKKLDEWFDKLTEMFKDD